ncbi:MAG: hypothetical protein AAF638_10600 [Pseudomonadota bacterium]
MTDIGTIKEMARLKTACDRLLSVEEKRALLAAYVMTTRDGRPTDRSALEAVARAYDPLGRLTLLAEALQAFDRGDRAGAATLIGRIAAMGGEPGPGLTSLMRALSGTSRSGSRASGPTLAGARAGLRPGANNG